MKLIELTAKIREITGNEFVRWDRDPRTDEVVIYTGFEVDLDNPTGDLIPIPFDYGQD